MRIGTLILFLWIAPIAVGQTLDFPSDWKTPPTDTLTGYAIWTRQPTFSPNSPARELRFCVGMSPPTLSPADCPLGSGNIPVAVPSTGYAIDISYRYTMSRLEPFMNDLNNRVKKLTSDLDSLKAEVESSRQDLGKTINARFDHLPAELIASEPVRKLKEDILKEVDHRIDLATTKK